MQQISRQRELRNHGADVSISFLEVIVGNNSVQFTESLKLVRGASPEHLFNSIGPHARQALARKHYETLSRYADLKI